MREYARYADTTKQGYGFYVESKIRVLAVSGQDIMDMIDVKNLSLSELISLCRGDVGTEIRLKIEVSSTFDKNRLLTLHAKRCLIEGDWR